MVCSYKTGKYNKHTSYNVVALTIGNYSYFHHLETNKYRVLQPAKLESHQACKLQLERALAGVLPVR
jgi:hypothetical protein